ncbi:MAG TPA: DUF3619 family protein [Gallionella sp.]|nr:DUF3619 family protein [Gallionella sp.]
MNIEPHLPEDRQDIDPEQIAGLLTLATEQMDRDTLEALRRARHAALDRQTTRAPAFALDGRHGLHFPIPHTARQWAAAGLLLAALAGGAGYWQHLHHHETMAHLDVAILTDDMPLEVFIDH